MSTQTVERKNIYSRIDALPDSALPMLDEYLDYLRYRLERVPNAETLAAIEELRAGKGEKVTISEIMAELNAGH